jgi:hypothetical protein
MTPAASLWRWRVLIAACAVAVALPLAFKGDSCGQDFDFHLQSWMAVAQHWRYGVLYPHWIQGANYGAGEPRLVFYPPFSWMLGALLGLVFPWNAVPVAFTGIVLAACGFSMNKLAREWLPANAAALAACAYILNPYALFVAYERTAYGELAAAIWLPLVILYTLRCARCYGMTAGLRTGSSALPKNPDPAKWTPGPHPPRQQSLPRNCLGLSLAIAAIWLTNAPAAVMASYSVAAIALWRAIGRREWKLPLPIAASLGHGLGLAGFYLVPAAWERRWVEIARALDPGMRIADSFLFEHTGMSYHDQVLRTASWIFVAMLTGIAISAWIGGKGRGAPRIALPLVATAALLLALQLPWSAFLWNHAPELRFLQFPWRWSLVLTMVLAISLGLVTPITRGNQLKQRFGWQIGLTLVGAVLVVCAGTRLFWQPCDDEDAVPAQVAVFRSGGGFDGTDEYTALGADNSIIQQNLPAVRVLKGADDETAQPGDADQGNPAYIASAQDELPAQIAIETWQPEKKSVTINSQTAGFAVLRLMDYPAWRIRLNGNQVRTRPHRDDGLIAFPIESGATRIDIVYASTADVLCGRILSGVSLMAMAALALWSRKRGEVGYYD